MQIGRSLNYSFTELVMIALDSWQGYEVTEEYSSNFNDYTKQIAGISIYFANYALPPKPFVNITAHSFRFIYYYEYSQEQEKDFKKNMIGYLRRELKLDNSCLRCYSEYIQNRCLTCNPPF